MINGNDIFDDIKKKKMPQPYSLDCLINQLINKMI
jgi:hypothetical protein